MKKNRFFISLAFLFVLLPCIKAQEMQQIKVYDGGKYPYSTKLSITDSITFFKYFGGTYEGVNCIRIKTGNEEKTIRISGIDSITFFTFTVPNNSTGVLINDVIWATCNLNSSGEFTNHPSVSGTYNTWQDALNKCPSGWRLPTESEYKSLINAGTFWGELDGVTGRFFGNDYQKVFFPAAGCLDLDGSLYSSTPVGNYWSNTSDNNTSTGLAWHLNLGKGLPGAVVRLININYGFNIRCVKEE